ncbi:MAG: DUF2156 domain-containing protein [Cetobacterium sp.]|uniref:DUF2156 domain-containing protein n=1 Tax=Cetobacterium sp. TaxID=2071632 RepID=UPI003F3DF3F0
MEWKNLSMDSKEVIDKYCKGKFQSSDLNFTNFLVWSLSEEIKYREDEDILYVKGFLQGKEYYFPPFHVDGLKALRKINLAFKKILDQGGQIFFIPEEYKILLEDRFNFVENRDYFDYIYLREDLETLAGRKYSKKKNKIAQFVKSYDYEYEKISQENIEEVKKFQEKWFENRKEDPMIVKENMGINLLLNNFDHLGIKGGLIRVGEEIVAYSLGEILNENTLLVHTEKALSDYKGSYQIINRLFVMNEGKKCFYINREDDSGIEGLREAKLTYFPNYLLKKYEIYE